jgi:hypothetical protein
MLLAEKREMGVLLMMSLLFLWPVSLVGIIIWQQRKQQ